jgi:hypothetical protein
MKRPVMIVDTAAHSLTRGTIRTTLLFLAFGSLASAAYASDNSLAGVGNMPIGIYDSETRAWAHLRAQWFACETTSDCELASVPCKASLAVGKAHKADAEAAICRVSQNCPSACDHSMLDDSVPICTGGQCLTTWSIASGHPIVIHTPSAGTGRQ